MTANLFLTKPGMEPFMSISTMLLTLVLFSSIFSRMYPPQWAKALTVSAQEAQGNSQLRLPKQILFPCRWKVKTPTSSLSETRAKPFMWTCMTVSPSSLQRIQKLATRSVIFFMKVGSLKKLAKVQKGRFMVIYPEATVLSSLSILLILTGLSSTSSHSLEASSPFRTSKNLFETAFKSASLGPFCITIISFPISQNSKDINVGHPQINTKLNLINIDVQDWDGWYGCR